MKMNKKTYKVIKGYSELTFDERKVIREAIERYEKEISNRVSIIKSFSDSVGPLDNNSCPCCGK